MTITTFIVLNIPGVAAILEKLFTKTSKCIDAPSIGTIFGVQSKNTFLVKLAEDRKEHLNIFDYVEFQYSIDGKQRKGVVLDVYYLNQAQWIKVLTTKEINSLFKSQLDSCKPDVVYKIMPPEDNDYLKRFVGVVIENTTIEKARFLYSSRVDINAGQLVEITVGTHRILFQVVEGITKIEQLENKNQTSYIAGEAVQLGEWNSETGRFERFGWVPSINTPVFLAANIEEPKLKPDEYQIGCIPGTNYPAIINKEMAVTHHTAILGVTGSGKSVFARNLIQHIASEKTKVVVVDLTGEYKERIVDITPIISDEKAERSFKAIEFIATEKSKFTRDQRQDQIAKAEELIISNFSDAIKTFLTSDHTKAIFELPDISNSANVLEYTRWFFWVLFRTAKTDNNFDKRVCVVLEEAHTIIPETNAMGVSDYASRATVNSIAQIALQGRKYNIGFIVIAQRIANVSKTVLTQCNSIIAFQELDKTSSDFLSNYMGEEFVKALPNLSFRNAIAVGKAFRSTTPILFEVPEIHEVINKISSQGKSSCVKKGTSEVKAPQ